ncbi:MAG: hypothetical protein U0175_18900 [Caldilineaceae bacterium]
MKQRTDSLWLWPTLVVVVMFLASCRAITVQPPPTDSAEMEPSVALNQRAVLSIQLGLDPNAIEIVEATPVTWPDDCLGKPDPAELCAPSEVAGYRIKLAVNGAEYLYHTNQDGSMVRLASAPGSQANQVVVEWTWRDDSGCSTVQIGDGSVVFGRCMSTLMRVPMLYAMRQNDLDEFSQTFAPFAAETPAGHLQFNGSGTEIATPAQQRMIAEWAQLVGLEARTSASGPNGGLLLAWHREGGLADFCDNVMVYRGGAVYLSSCKGQNREPEEIRLDSTQLATLYGWLDTFVAFNFEHSTVGEADSITTTFVFTGLGTQEIDSAEQALMMDFAQNLFQEGRMATSALPSDCVQPEEGQQPVIQAEDGYCLLYPEAYSLWQQNVGKVEIISDTVMNHITPRLTISVEDAVGRTLDAVVAQMLTDYAPPGFDIKPESITVAGVAAVLLDEVLGADLTRRVVLIHNGRLYSFFLAPISDPETETRQQAESLYQMAMSSFRLLQPSEIKQ